MTLTVNMARPTIGAGPTPKDQNVDYRSIERIITAIDGGHIQLTPTLDYIDRRTSRDVNDPVYAAEDRGYIALKPGGRIEITESGRQWMGRDRKRARKALTPTFESPAVA